jgi:hypothetical protein
MVHNFWHTTSISVSKYVLLCDAVQQGNKVGKDIAIQNFEILNANKLERGYSYHYEGFKKQPKPATFHVFQQNRSGSSGRPFFRENQTYVL